MSYQSLETAAKACPIVPVFSVSDLDNVEGLAGAMVKGGLSTAEITLRTPEGLEAVKLFKQAQPDLLVGAGTILTTRDVEQAVSAGADFLVTPAVSSRLLGALLSSPVPVLPGTATPSEALEMHEEGFEIVKFFPAETNGGAAALKNFAAPMPNIRFMPTGGINGQKVHDYLAVPTVVAVGGSWMIDKDLIKAKDWDALAAAIATEVKNVT